MIADQSQQDEALPGHPRTAGALRQNRQAWLVLCRWMEQAGYLTPDEVAQLNLAHLEARRYSAEAQDEAQRDERPSAKWLDILRSRIAIGECVIDDGSLDENTTKPERIIGWSPVNGGIAIIAAKAFDVVEKVMGRRTLNYSESAIYAQLRSDGVLLDDGSKQKTVTQVRRYKGVQLRVLIFRPEALYGSDDRATPATPGDPVSVAPAMAIESPGSAPATPATPATALQHEKSQTVTSLPEITTSPKHTSLPTNRCSGVAGADLGHQNGQKGATPSAVAATNAGVAAPRMPLSGTPMIPQINKEKIQLIKDKLADRGPLWARNFMSEVEGFEKWPFDVQQLVIQAEAAETS